MKKFSFKKPIYLGLILFGVSPTTFAFFCPSNFNQIEMGNTIPEVLAQCGKPARQKESTKVNDNIPQEWSYFVPQAVSANTFAAAQGTLKASVAFDSDGKAINISVNGLGVGATSLCGRYIKLGDTKEDIQTACGDPTLVNRQANAQTGQAIPADQIKVVEFSYDSTPPVTLVFENGKLTGRK